MEQYFRNPRREKAQRTEEIDLKVPAGFDDCTFDKCGGVFKRVDTASDDPDGTPAEGATVRVFYEGFYKGKMFDSVQQSLGTDPLEFIIGAHSTLRCFEEAVVTMTRGEVATIISDPSWAYHMDGLGGIVPREAVVSFQIKLLDWEPHRTPAERLDIADALHKHGKAIFAGEIPPDASIPPPARTLAVHSAPPPFRGPPQLVDAGPAARAGGAARIWAGAIQLIGRTSRAPADLRSRHAALVAVLHSNLAAASQQRGDPVGALATLVTGIGAAEERPADVSADIFIKMLWRRCTLRLAERDFDSADADVARILAVAKDVASGSAGSFRGSVNPSAIALAEAKGREIKDARRAHTAKQRNKLSEVFKADGSTAAEE